MTSNRPEPETKKMKIIIPGNIASKKNSRAAFVRGTKRKGIIPIPSKAYQRWEENSREYIKLQYRGRPETRALSVKALIFYKGNRHDLSNALEAIGDCFEGFIWENDKQIQSWDGSRMIHDPKKPRVELTVELFEETPKPAKEV
jgi:Holliday junction resolvase RusA-like endonuclease